VAFRSRKSAGGRGYFEKMGNAVGRATGRILGKEGVSRCLQELD